MLLENEVCTVKISLDDTYTVGSADNRHYDMVINPSDLSSSDLSKTFSISIDVHHHNYMIALVGSYLSCEYDCAILEGNNLLVLQDDNLVVIDVLSGALIKSIHMDCFGSNFSIYRIPKGYIIYGEIEIIMLNDAFEKQWTFSGRDIFVTQSNKNPFAICDNAIELFDWEDNYYKIDFGGNLLEEKPTK